MLKMDVSTSVTERRMAWLEPVVNVVVHHLRPSLSEQNEWVIVNKGCFDGEVCEAGAIMKGLYLHAYVANVKINRASGERECHTVQ